MTQKQKNIARYMVNPDYRSLVDMVVYCSQTFQHPGPKQCGAASVLDAVKIDTLDRPVSLAPKKNGG